MIIYQNYDYDLEEARKDYKEHLMECLGNTEAEALETIALDNNVYSFIDDTFNMYYDDERCNLDKTIDNDIIAIADIGRWNGRKRGYKELSDNLNSIFECWESCDYIKLYTYRGNVHGKGDHHDGTNNVTFRKWINNITDNQKDLLLTALYSGDEAINLIKRYTRSILPDIKNVYGC